MEQHTVVMVIDGWIRPLFEGTKEECQEWIDSNHEYLDRVGTTVNTWEDAYITSGYVSDPIH